MTTVSFILIYTTFSSKTEAKELSRWLLQERKVACAQLLPAVNSLYMWDGELCDSSEVGVLLKTSFSLKDIVVQDVIDRHSYECPCVLEFPLQSLNSAYSQWLNENLRACD